MKKLLPLICLFLALGAWTAPIHAEEQGAAPKEAKPEAPKEAKGGGEEGGGTNKKDNGVSGGRFAGDPVYVHLDPMVMPVISDAGVEQLITMQIDIEVKDFDVADNIHTNMPRIKDALMQALYGGLGQGSLRQGKLVDVTKIKVKATAALERVVGDGGIRDVLIQGVAQRML